ncbi:MAG: hydrogenase maturation protein HypF, partial [Coriobacteriia bacterium]|nr:hydrogenase maturation protein HypF [Coriobacteriia bacterium]
WLRELGLLEHPGAQPFLSSIGDEQQALLQTMLDKNLNSPLTSSMGRLFDALSALLGICAEASYEGEPAIELEAVAWMARGKDATSYRFGFDGRIIDPYPLLESLLEGLAHGEKASTLARRCLNAVVAMVVEVAERLRGQTGLADVALSGGFFMNRYIMERLPQSLGDCGFNVC